MPQSDSHLEAAGKHGPSRPLDRHENQRVRGRPIDEIEMHAISEMRQDGIKDSPEQRRIYRQRVKERIAGNGRWKV